PDALTRYVYRNWGTLTPQPYLALLISCFYTASSPLELLSINFSSYHPSVLGYLHTRRTNEPTLPLQAQLTLRVYYRAYRLYIRAWVCFCLLAPYIYQAQGYRDSKSLTDNHNVSISHVQTPCPMCLSHQLTPYHTDLLLLFPTST